MTVSPISLPPPAPSRTTDDPATFANKADAWVGWWTNGSAELNTSFGQFNVDVATVNAKASQVAADKVHVAADRMAIEDIWGGLLTEALPEGNGSSPTNITIGIGSKVFAASAGKIWFPGMAIIARSAASAANYMAGEVASYDASTGALTISVYVTGGAGAYADWLIYPAGQRYTNGWTEIGTLATTSGNSVTFANVPGIFSDLLLMFDGVSHNSVSNKHLIVAVSDNGVDYTGTPSLTGGAGVAAGYAVSGGVLIPGYKLTSGAIIPGLSALGGSRAASGFAAAAIAWKLPAAITHIRISPSADAFDAGSITLLGK